MQDTNVTAEPESWTQKGSVPSRGSYASRTVVEFDGTRCVIKFLPLLRFAQRRRDIVHVRDYGEWKYSVILVDVTGCCGLW